MRRIPDFHKTTSLVARALGLSAEQLSASFRPAGERDLPRVSALRQAEFKRSSADDTAYLAWRYRFGRPDRGAGECWLLERGDEVLAVLGTEDVLLQHAGGEYKVTFLMDILVREDLRGVAIGPWMNMALTQHHECVCAIGSNRNSSGMVMALFQHLRWLRTYTFYLRCDYIVDRHIKAPALRALVAGLGNTALRLWRAAHSRNDRSWRIAEIQRLEELGTALRSWEPPPGEIRRVRDLRFLSWRAFQHPKRKYRILGAWRDSTLVAYLIVQDATVYGQRALRLMDWLCAPDQEGALSCLISTAVRQAAAGGCSLITSSLLHERTEATLKRLGFSMRSAEAISFAYRCRESHPLSELEPSWCVTPLDGDID